MDQYRVDAFEVRQYDQLLQRGGVAHVARLLGVGLPPLRGREAEQRYVEQVRLAGVDDADLRGRQARRDQTLFDGVGVNPVIDLGQRALEAPFQRGEAGFFILEALEFLDEINLEFRAEP